MKLYKGNSFAEVYKASLTDLIRNPEYSVSPRGLKINESMNVAHVVENPAMCLYENEKRSSQLKYIAAETVYYFSGRRDLDFISRFAPFWNQIANNDKTVNSAYGNLIFNEVGEGGLTQWQWAYNSLIHDKDTRQAILLFNKPNYQYYGNKDFICTLNGVFNIRDNKLNFTVQMRSNDAILGTATDFSFFCLLQMQMLKLLKMDKYPELELGSFTHIANSYHVYERHFELIEEMISSDFKPTGFPEIVYDFIRPDGKPTQELDKLIEAVEIKNINYETTDSLYNWIFTKTTG
jgi:thymidylate synthase